MKKICEEIKSKNLPKKLKQCHQWLIDRKIKNLDLNHIIYKHLKFFHYKNVSF